MWAFLDFSAAAISTHAAGSQSGRTWSSWHRVSLARASACARSTWERVIALAVRAPAMRSRPGAAEARRTGNPYGTFFQRDFAGSALQRTASRGPRIRFEPSFVRRSNRPKGHGYWGLSAPSASSHATPARRSTSRKPMRRSKPSRPARLCACVAATRCGRLPSALVNPERAQSELCLRSPKRR